MIKILSNQ